MKRYAMVKSAILPLCMAISAGAQAPAALPAKVHKIAIGGDGGWDYLTADATAKRLYVSRGNRIIVIDTDSEKVVGELTDTPGVHGVAVAGDSGRGFTSNGGDDTVTVFDLQTLKPTDKIKTGGRPDAIMYDPASNRIFTFNHGSKDATAIDPSAVSVAGTVALDGVPEAAVADGRGHVFVNIAARYSPRYQSVGAPTGAYSMPSEDWRLARTVATGP
jgi:YVTN family beta-propeller protein